MLFRSPENLKSEAEKYHHELIEKIVEQDDEIMNNYLEGKTPGIDVLKKLLREGVIANEIFPVYAGSALKNKGVQLVLDAVIDYLPSPLDVPPVKGIDPKTDESITRKASDSEPFSALAFKVATDPFVGQLIFFRVYSGNVTTGQDLYNSSQSSGERMGQLFVLNGKNRTSVQHMNAGDIGAVVKLKNTHTGDTLCSVKFKVLLPRTDYPNPNIHAAIKLKSKGDEEKISMGLASLHEEDPTFVYRVDSEIRQTIISGQGELHLKAAVDRLKERFDVEIEMIEPKIPYRETILGKGESKYRHKKQSGGAGQFAEVWMRIEPKKRGEGVEFTDTLKGQNVDRVFVPSVEKGVQAVCIEGVIAGYHVVDVKVDFYDGKQHPVDSKDIAFQTAGRSEERRVGKECRSRWSPYQ